MGFTRKELDSFCDTTVADLIGPNLKLLFVGINPGLWTAATQTHFAHPGNRFYPALLQAGIIEREVDRRTGFTDEDRQHFLNRGIGITNLAPRATAKASELSTAELQAGRQRLDTCIARHQPNVVAIAGITAYRTAYGQRKARAGRQSERLGNAALWVVPNPSGLNAHETTATLAEAYLEPALEAKLLTN